MPSHVCPSVCLQALFPDSCGPPAVIAVVIGEAITLFPQEMCPGFLAPHHQQHDIPLVAQLANSSPWECCSRQSKFPEASQVDMQAVTDRLTGSRDNYPRNLCTLYMRRCKYVFVCASTCVFSCQIF